MGPPIKNQGSSRVDSLQDLGYNRIMKTYKIRGIERNEWFKKIQANTEEEALEKIDEYWSEHENFSFENFQDGKTNTTWQIVK